MAVQQGFSELVPLYKLFEKRDMFDFVNQMKVGKGAAQLKPKWVFLCVCINKQRKTNTKQFISIVLVFVWYQLTWVHSVVWCFIFCSFMCIFFISYFRHVQHLVYGATLQSLIRYQNRFNVGLYLLCGSSAGLCANCVSSSGLRPGLVPATDRPAAVGRLGLSVWAGAEELPAAVQLLQEPPSLRGQSHTAVQRVEGFRRHHAVRNKWL